MIEQSRSAGSEYCEPAVLGISDRLRKEARLKTDAGQPIAYAATCQAI